MQNKLKSEEIALRIRRRVFEHCIKNNGAYLSQACSSAEQLAWLYNEALNNKKFYFQIFKFVINYD